jgi:acid phosphatase
MFGGMRLHPSGRWIAPLVMAAALGWVAPAHAQDPRANDRINAVLWMPRSVEYQAASLGAFVLARIRLEQALTDPSGTAAPKEPIGADPSLPPAVVLDADETILANWGYEAWMIAKDTTVDPKTWTAYVDSVSSLAIPCAVDFARDAEARGVKVFDVSNRHRRGRGGHDDEPGAARLAEGGPLTPCGAPRSRWTGGSA